VKPHAVTLMIMAISITAWSADPELEVAPGSVVRWPGDATVSACVAAGERFATVEGTCLYPIDLLTSAGTYEIGRVRVGRMETTTVDIAAYPYTVERLTVSSTHVAPSTEDSERARRESQRVARLWTSRRPGRPSLPLDAPLAQLTAGRNFGTRRIFNSQPRSPHSGVDFAAVPGTAVHAVASGSVVLAEEHFFAGNSIFIDHGDGLVSMYFHLETMTVETGQSVSRGEVIGTVGATGRVTGPHLHFGLRWRGSRIDPTALLVPPEDLPTVATGATAGADQG